MIIFPYLLVVWQHINIQGEYDFSEKSLENAIDFQLHKLVDFKMENFGGTN
jgi:hypothetical protein